MRLGIIAIISGHVYIYLTMEPADREEQIKPIPFAQFERDLVLSLYTLDPEIERRFKLAIIKDGQLIVPLNAYDLDEFLGSIAFVANHSEDRKQRKVLDELFAKVSEVLESEFPIEETGDDLKVAAEIEAKKIVDAANAAPLDDFCGLSPDEMHRLIYKPFFPDGTCPLKLCPSIEESTLGKIPFFRLTEEMLRIVEREGSIKLTPALGALPRKVIRELYAHKLITEEFIESGIANLNHESDSAALTMVHWNTVYSRIVKEKGGKLTLSREGKRLLKRENRRELFSQILETFTQRTSWGSTDRFTDFPVAQMGWGFSVYLLMKFGHEPRPTRFYAEKYLKAFPMTLNQVRPIHAGSPLDDLVNCYESRTFRLFMKWFGLASYVKGGGFFDRTGAIITATEILPKVFVFR